MGSSRGEANIVTPVTVIVFDVLQSVALFIAILALLPAFLSRSVHRVKTWFCLLISCVVYCISFLLLAGHQTGPDPSLGLCLIQAGLIYAAPPLVAASGMLFVIELYLRISAVTLTRKVNEGLIIRLLWIIPIVHALVFWVAVLRGLSDLNTIERDPTGMFCHVKQRIPTLLTGATVVLFMLFAIVFEIFTVIHLFRKRITVKDIVVTRRELPLKFFIRTFCYTAIVGIVVLIVIVINFTENTALTLNLLGLIPLSVALAAGTQTDILQVYMFWRKPSFDIPPRDQS